MNRLILIIGYFLAIVGLFKIDLILYKGLNYFGKYIFFVLFNIFILYIIWWSRRYKFFPIILGVGIFFIGYIIGV